MSKIDSFLPTMEFESSIFKQHVLNCPIKDQLKRSMAICDLMAILEGRKQKLLLPLNVFFRDKLKKILQS